MDRRHFRRAAQIVVSAAFGVLCLLVVVVWLRSFWRVTTLAYAVHPVNIDSNRGELIVSQSFKFPIRGSWGWEDRPVDVRDRSYRMTHLGFFYQRRGSLYWLVIPYWFPVLIAGTLAAVPWFRWRFSVRTLLIATTLIGLALGWIAWLVR